MMMTVKQVAEALEVSERSVWRWSATGILPPGIKIGGVVRWPRRTIEEWLAKREQEALARQKASSGEGQQPCDEAMRPAGSA